MASASTSWIALSMPISSIVALVRLCTQFVVSASLTAVQKPMTLVKITRLQDAMSGVYSCMPPRRSQIFEENPREGTSLIQVKAYLPVSESFGFVAVLCQATSGQAFPQCVLDHWEAVPGDVMVEGKQDCDAFVYRRCDISWRSRALEGVQDFETLFGNASATGKLSLYTHVPALLEACGHKEKPVDKVASALLTTMYAACLTWSGAYVLPFLKEGLQAKAKPEIKIVTCDVQPNTL